MLGLKSYHYPVVCGLLEVLDIHNTYVSRGSLLNELDLDGSLFSVRGRHCEQTDTPSQLRALGWRFIDLRGVVSLVHVCELTTMSTSCRTFADVCIIVADLQNTSKQS